MGISQEHCPFTSSVFAMYQTGKLRFVPSVTDTPVTFQDRTSWFCHYRDRFRDQLSHKDPRSFPRRGPLPASASRILEITFGQATGPYLVQHLICANCRVLSQAECKFCLLALTYNGSNQTPTWLHTIWTEFICRSGANAARLRAVCPHCKGQNKVQELRMPDVPWIWFERERHSPVWPSLTLMFNSSSQQLSYSLRAIIYAGEHLQTPRAEVWGTRVGSLLEGRGGSRGPLREGGSPKSAERLKWVEQHREG